MNPVGKPQYMLPPEYLWLRRFKNNPKVLKRLRNRAIRAFEYSIKEENYFNERKARICMEVMERYWAARYPDVVECLVLPWYNISERNNLEVTLCKNQLLYYKNLSRELEGFDYSRNTFVSGKDEINFLKAIQLQRHNKNSPA